MLLLNRSIPAIAVSLLVGLGGLVPVHYAFLVPTTPSSHSYASSSSSTCIDGRRFRFRMAASTLNDAETTNTASTTSIKPQTKAKSSPPSPSPLSFRDQLTNSGIASAALLATAAVNQAVSMKSLEAPSVDKSFIAIQKMTTTELDEEGLPLVYDKDLIQEYWSKQKGALNQRWSFFVGKAVPFLTKLISLWIKDGGQIKPDEIPALSKQARLDLQDLGPTFIKLGQMMSVRPDILPESTLQELALLQDSVIPFDTQVAIQQIERELGGPLGQFFTTISQEPVAAASLAQVYLATLADGKDTKVAVKVQRPSVLGTVSKDLYVLRRAAEVVQGLVERFAPQQRTNYVGLLNEWAIGFYTELDFTNEARNQERLRQIIVNSTNNGGVVVPKVFPELCTRRILVSEWMHGKKLSLATKEEIARVTPIAQEAFLTQLFEAGFAHADPHSGNLLLLDPETAPGGAQLAIIDCGLMATISQEDRDSFVSAVIHLANKDFASLVDDFIKLQILPPQSDRAAIIPLMNKALSPYLSGGGAKKYEQELKKLYGMEDSNLQSTVGGFQAMTQDALTVLNDVPFSIPPYFAILGRAIVTLEGIALTGNPDYAIIMEAYPFIARKLMQGDRPEIQMALQQVLYDTNKEGSDSNSNLKLSRLLALLNNAAGAVATNEGAAVVDLDAVPQDGISFQDGLKFVLSAKAAGLRNLLEKEVDTIVDVLARQIVRQGISEATVALTPPRPPALFMFGDLLPPSPKLDQIPLPLLLPGADGIRTPGVALITLQDLTNIVVPKLSQQEELYALGLADAAAEFFGDEVGKFVRGESVLSVQSFQLLLSGLRSGVLGKTNVLSRDSIQGVVNATTRLLSLARSDSQSDSMLDQELSAALDNLDSTERQQLDAIVQELTERQIRRILQRLSTIDRLI